MKHPIDIALLRKFVNKQCTKEELVQIREFMRHPAYRRALEEMLDKQWEQFDPVSRPGEADLQDWRTEFDSRKKIAAAPTVIKPIKKFHWLGYAAAACILISFFIFLHSPSSKDNRSAIAQVVMKEIVNPAGQRSTIVLPDSSVITLGPTSRLRYPEVFATNAREISLEGEAFFEVSRNPKKPFIIHTGVVQTRVLGTSFKIDALKGKPVCVAVATGKVSVSLSEGGKEQILAILTPGKLAIYGAPNNRLELHDFMITEIKDWKNGLLSFSGLPIDEAIESLERWYNVEISNKGAIDGSKRIKLVVDGKKPINDALETMTALTGLKYRINGKQIQIY